MTATRNRWPDARMPRSRVVSVERAIPPGQSWVDKCMRPDRREQLLAGRPLRNEPLKEAPKEGVWGPGWLTGVAK
ncbi:hypothetical protein R54767_04703 [Paraburkholderia gardini]|uniref:Uncharacterized protein n=1 Tax=Paraburkholderia gardini TaxID=2823469 RepID=A0ABM8UA67_9BURK|nr:hypothetical protein R54767_04703 [Paraburkholderia gardini]